MSGDEEFDLRRFVSQEMARQVSEENAKPGYYKIRAYRRGPFLPAEIRETVPIDPDTGEILDRSTVGHVEALVDGRPVALERLVPFGQQISKDEFEWLRALTAIRQM